MSEASVKRQRDALAAQLAEVDRLVGDPEHPRWADPDIRQRIRRIVHAVTMNEDERDAFLDERDTLVRGEAETRKAGTITWIDLNDENQSGAASLDGALATFAAHGVNPADVLPTERLFLNYETYEESDTPTNEDPGVAGQTP